MRQIKNQIRRARRIFRAAAGRDLFLRAEARCPKIRLGNERAEWCVSTEGLTEGSLVYSFGVGEDISFEMELIRRFGVEVHAFDPTPRSIRWMRAQQCPPGLFFHEYGIAERDGSASFYPPENAGHVSYSVLFARGAGSPPVEAPVRRLATIMNLLGHDQIAVLKMDIEVAEYGVIRDVIASRAPVCQLLVEFHHRWPEVGVGKTREAVRNLRHAGFKIFDVSPSGEEFGFVRV